MSALWTEFKLYVIGALVTLLLLAAVAFAHHERGIGAAKVQAQWDAATAAQAKLAVAASETARATEHQQTSDFSAIESNYLKAATHVDPAFDLSAAVAGGTLRLRDDCPAPDRRSVPQAAARSRGADAAAAEAIAKRVQAASTVVRVGNTADAREQQLREQVIALQAVLRAERP